MNSTKLSVARNELYIPLPHLIGMSAHNFLLMAMKSTELSADETLHCSPDSQRAQLLSFDEEETRCCLLIAMISLLSLSYQYNYCL